jgi:SAM-dependent methyltransferase
MLIEYLRKPDEVIVRSKPISCLKDVYNVDTRTVAAFGDEWTRFDHFSDDEISTPAAEYFDILPPALLSGQASLLDVGCGTGRRTKYLAGRMRWVDAIDPSSAIFAADRLLAGTENVRLTQCSVNNLPFPGGAYDLVMSVGVLHHVPDTSAALRACVRKAKPGGYVYVYLYYNLDNRGPVFRWIFSVSNRIRKAVSALPAKPRLAVCDVLAAVLYMPWVWLSRALRFAGLRRVAERLPLASYHNKSWHVIRANALDRFGTPLEQRFSRAEVERMMRDAGLSDIVISDRAPFYHAIGRRN